MGNLQVISGQALSRQQAQEKGVELYNNYIEYLDVAPKTLESYRKALKQFFIYLWEHDIRHPERKDIINYKKYLKDTGHKAGTIQNYIIITRQFFKWTAQEGLYPNVADNVKGAKISHEHKRDHLTANQLKKVLKEIDQTTEKGARDYAAILLMATAGLRTIEVVRANIEDIRPIGNAIGIYVQGKGHEEKDAFVPLSEEVEAAINKYLKTRKNPATTAPLFASTSRNNKGERVTTRAVRAMVKERFKNVGLESDRLTAHSLRHTAVTLSLLGGEKLEQVQTMARHVDINTTMIYNHAINMTDNTCCKTVTSMIFN